MLRAWPVKAWTLPFLEELSWRSWGDGGSVVAFDALVDFSGSCWVESFTACPPPLAELTRLVTDALNEDNLPLFSFLSLSPPAPSWFAPGTPVYVLLPSPSITSKSSPPIYLVYPVFSSEPPDWPPGDSFLSPSSPLAASYFGYLL